MKRGVGWLAINDGMEKKKGCQSIGLSPMPSNSRHQNYYGFSTGSQPEPAFALLVGEGTTQPIHYKIPI